MIVLRIGKRRASYTATNPQEFCELECWDRSADVADRHLSVYEIEDLDPMIIRTHAEHAAGVGLDPPRGGCHWNMSEESQEPMKTPGECGFVHADEAHRELVFETPEAVIAFAERIWRQSENRRRITTKALLHGYVRARLDEGDPEWVRFRSQATKGAAWCEKKW